MTAVRRQRDFGDEEAQCYDVFQSFLDEKHEREMVGILLYEDAEACYSVVVNSLELFDSNIEVSQLLVSNPRKILPVFHEALRNCLRSLYDEHRLGNSMKLKKNAFVRLSNLPTCPELTRNTIPKSSDIGRLLALNGKFRMSLHYVHVSGVTSPVHMWKLFDAPRSSCDQCHNNSLGTVTRVTSVKLVEWEKEFVCMKCRFVFKVTGDFEKSYSVQKPTHCPSPDSCSSIKFSCLSESGKYVRRHRYI